MPNRQSKIIATLGPATASREALRGIIRAGVDVVRLNLSHNAAPADLAVLVKMIRELAEEEQRFVAILFDLQGPKIRIANFEQGRISLKRGAAFNLVVGMRALGNQQQVGVTYANLTRDCKLGDLLLLDDGRITMRVKAIKGKTVQCRVVTGGILSNRKGLNKLKGGFSAASITAKDRQDIKTAVALGADYIAVSFVRCAADLELAKRLIAKAGGAVPVIAKVETAMAVKNKEQINSIVLASDGVMIARGDLGVEIGETRLIGLQKDLIMACRLHDRLSITATQMMETMVENKLPTRAEVSDVANAVLDGSDAVMLSAETAVGNHPRLVVETMAQICKGASSYHGKFSSESEKAKNPEGSKGNIISRRIARSAVHTAESIDKVVALVSLTESGKTALYMSRLNTRIPIYGLSRHPETLRRMALYRDVVPLYFAQPDEQVGLAILDFMRHSKFIKSGERLVLTSGMRHNVSGSTNVMRVLQA